MEATLEGDHRGASCEEPCQLDGVLDRLRAGVEERRPHAAADRDEGGESLRELDVPRVGDDGEIGVEKPRDLLRNGVEHTGMAVTDVDHTDSAGEIDEHISVDVGDRGAFGALGEDREVDVERRGHRRVLPGDELLRTRAWKSGVDLRSPWSSPRAQSTRATGYARPVDTFLDELPDDPNERLAQWLSEGRAAGAPEPEAMALASSTSEGIPSVRMVLLRGHDERGLVFYTNRESRKGRELDANPRAAVVFYWAPPLGRQVRVEGRIEPVTEAESAAYFASRPRSSQIGAWASAQSSPLADRNELERHVAECERRFEGTDVPLPPFWGGYRLVPDVFELWVGRADRLHDRARYERGTGGWLRERLAP